MVYHSKVTIVAVSVGIGQYLNTSIVKNVDLNWVVVVDDGGSHVVGCDGVVIVDNLHGVAVLVEMAVTQEVGVATVETGDGVGGDLVLRGYIGEPRGGGAYWLTADSDNLGAGNVEGFVGALDGHEGTDGVSVLETGTGGVEIVGGDYFDLDVGIADHCGLVDLFPVDAGEILAHRLEMGVLDVLKLHTVLVVSGCGLEGSSVLGNCQSLDVDVLCADLSVLDIVEVLRVGTILVHGGDFALFATRVSDVGFQVIVYVGVLHVGLDLHIRTLGSSLRQIEPGSGGGTVVTEWYLLLIVDPLVYNSGVRSICHIGEVSIPLTVSDALSHSGSVH